MIFFAFILSLWNGEYNKKITKNSDFLCIFYKILKYIFLIRESLKPEQIFSVLSDDLTIKILKSALIGFPADYYWKELGITRKQYYDRLHKLRQIDLVRRKSNIYKVTALGQIIVHIVLGTVEEVVTNYWRLTALESFQHTIPPEERIRIINLMLSNTKIKEYLL